MAKRDHARGRAADVEPTVLLERCERLLSLIDEGRHGTLLADLSSLRAGWTDTDDPLIRNLLESLHHLGLAWNCCLEGDDPADRDDAGANREQLLRGQLRSLCCSVRELAGQATSPAAVDRKPVADRSLTALVGSLLNAFSGQARAAPMPPAAIDPTGGRMDVEGSPGGSNSPTSDVGTCVPEKADAPGFMSVYFFGTFRVCLDGAFVKEWRNARSKLVLKYLIAHKERSIAKEYLMELFWPNTNPECARNNLNVAIYNIRQALKQNGWKMRSVFYKDGHYSLNPDVTIWTDLDAFSDIVDRAKTFAKAGDAAKEISALASLDELYGGDVLEEDRFEDWVLPLRQRFKEMYWDSLIKRADYFFCKHRYKQSIDMYKKIQAIDGCDEQVHARLMTCYARLGQHHLAMRQFSTCVEVLARELDIGPDAATVELYERIRRREAV